MRVVRIKTHRQRARGRRRLMAALLLLMGCLLAFAGWRLLEGDYALPRLTVQFASAPQPAVARDMTLTLPRFFALQAGEYASRAEAQAALDAQGGAGIVYGGAPLLVDLFDTRAAALAAARISGGKAYELPGAAVTLRASGTEAQLSALGDAHRYIAGAPERLRALSQASDAAAAQNALQSERATCLSLVKALSQAFPSPMPSAAEELTALLAALAAEMRENAAPLATQIKRCSLLCAAEALDYAMRLQ